MKSVLKKYESVNMDEFIVEDGKEIKKSMPYLKLSMYVKPEDFPDVTSHVGATMDVYRPEEYAEALKGNIVIPQRIKEGMKTILIAWQDLLEEAEKGEPG